MSSSSVPPATTANVQDGSKRFPSGLNLPNMVTVGNIMNDGTNKAKSNMASANFEVTIAAPGQESIFGLDNNGKITTGFGGTSMATPPRHRNYRFNAFDQSPTSVRRRSSRF